MDAHWKREIAELELAINLEEENYKLAMQSQSSFYSLKRMRLNIKRMKGELQVFLDSELQNRIDNPRKKVSR